MFHEPRSSQCRNWLAPPTYLGAHVWESLQELANVVEGAAWHDCKHWSAPPTASVAEGERSKVNYAKLTVARLKERLLELGVSAEGKKADMVEQLEEAEAAHQPAMDAAIADEWLCWRENCAWTRVMQQKGLLYCQSRMRDVNP